MSERMRILAVLVSLALPAAALWVAHRSGQQRLAFPLARLEALESSYRRTHDQPLAPDVLEQVRPDAYVQRAYQEPGGLSLWLYLGLYAGLQSEGAHSPEICYPAQGWEVIEARTTWVPLASGERFRARLVRVAQGNRYEWVLWWFQPSGRWTRGDALEQLLRIYDGVRGNPQYGFVRLSTPALEGELPPRSLVEFAAALAPRVREVVDGARPAPQRARLARVSSPPAR